MKSILRYVRPRIAVLSSTESFPAERAARLTGASRPWYYATVMESVSTLEACNLLVSLYVLQADGASVHGNVAGPDCALQDKRGGLEALVRVLALCEQGPHYWRSVADDHLNFHGCRQLFPDCPWCRKAIRLDDAIAQGHSR